MTQAPPKKQIGELLKEKGFINEEHIRYALQEQKITKEKLGELFERLGFVTEHDLVTTLAEQSGLEYMDVDETVPDEAILKLFNKNLCLNNILQVYLHEFLLYLYMVDQNQIQIKSTVILCIQE